MLLVERRLYVWIGTTHHSRKLKDEAASAVAHRDQAQEIWRWRTIPVIFVKFSVFIDDVADFLQASADVIGVFSDSSVHAGFRAGCHRER